MDRLIADKDVKTKTEIKQEQQQESSAEKISIKMTSAPPNTEYLNSLENMTIADFKKQEDEKKAKEFEKEKDLLIKAQYEEKVEQKDTPAEVQEVFQNTIEKPNYDLIEEKTVVKIKVKSPQKKSRKKLTGLALAISLAFTAGICVVNTIIIDNLSSNFLQIEETYKLNLGKYLKDINNLDSTKKSMEFLETYPDDINEATEVGEKSNWFDRFCQFLSGIFGG